LRILKASRCTLEPLVAAHADAMFDVLSDPAIYEFENDPPQSVAWLADRYSFLERRGPMDGTQKWLNWVIRLPSGDLAGYVQATVLQSGSSYVAYELASRYWRRGIGSSAVLAMMDELRSAYGVHGFVAVLKTANYRSFEFLRSLGFTPASAQQSNEFGAEPDERVMVKGLVSGQNVV
jgi:[ribosomal protein S5]-alanine N-acetyltransferase